MHINFLSLSQRTAAPRPAEGWPSSPGRACGGVSRDLDHIIIVCVCCFMLLSIVIVYCIIL